MDILTLFFKNPEKEYNVREVARALKIAPTTASIQLSSLKKKSLLISHKERNYLLYKANLQSKSFINLKLFHNIENLYTSHLISFLLDYYNEPAAIILFGSYRKAQDIPSSDIDLCIITSLKNEPNLAPYEKRLGHKIQLFLLSRQQFKETNHQLANNIINGIVLEGFLEVFS